MKTDFEFVDRGWFRAFQRTVAWREQRAIARKMTRNRGTASVRRAASSTSVAPSRLVAGTVHSALVLARACLVAARSIGSSTATSTAIAGTIWQRSFSAEIAAFRRNAARRPSGVCSVPGMGIGRDVNWVPAPVLSAVRTGRSIVTVIGINEYSRWPKLTNAVADATGIAQLFVQLGFVEVVPRLLDAEATGNALRRLVTDDLSRLSPDDNLVLFFAGHGHTHTTKLGDTSIKTGYVIPVDASSVGGQVATWVRLDSWLSDVSRLPPRHILVIIDACHSGVALGALVKWRAAVPPTGTTEELQRRLSRRIITSALDDQIAMDSGPYPQHSLFTGCLMEGLRGGLAGRGRSVVTGSEIGLYVQQRVSTYPYSAQTPDFGALEHDDRGELVVPIMPPNPAPDVVSAEPTPGPLSPLVEISASPSGATAPLSLRVRHPQWWWVSAIGGTIAVLGSTLLFSQWGSLHDSPLHSTLPPGPTRTVSTMDAAASAPPADASPAGAPSTSLVDDGVRGHDKSRGHMDHMAACRKGNPAGCENALHALSHGAAWEHSELQTLAIDCEAKESPCVAKALLTHDSRFAARACAAGVPTGCLIATLDNEASNRGPDLRHAFSMLGDDMVDRSFLRGLQFAFGLGVRRDLRTSMQLLKHGCAVGDPASCELLDCLSFEDSVAMRMDAVALCQREGVLSEHLVRLVKDALVLDALGHR